MHNSAILRFQVKREHQGRTSVRYSATVYADDIETGEEEVVFATQVTFVCVDDTGQKRPIGD